MTIAYLAVGKIRRMGDEPTTDEEIRVFVGRKVGELHADLAKLIAILSLWAQPQTAQRYRLLTYGILAWLVILTIILIAHVVLFPAGLFGR